MTAIVYTSNTGHTARYAKMIGAKVNLPVYELREAAKLLEQGTQVIYLGWLFANQVSGFRKAKKLFDIVVVCAVGLCDTGTATAGIREANAMMESLPLFTLQGGMDKTSLQSSYRFAINLLTKCMEAKQDKTEDDERMLYLLKNDADYVCEENIAAFMQWYGAVKE